MNINKLMRIIWIGPNQAPMKWINTWKNKHPDWEFYVFTDEMLKSRKWHNQHLIDEYYKRQKWSGVADLIRYEMLYEDGGFIPPADAECYHNTEELFNMPKHMCYTVYENEKIRPGYTSPIYACNPGNEFVKMLIDELHKLKANELSDRVWETTGNVWLPTMIAKKPELVKIFPSYHFIPVHYSIKSTMYIGPGKVYASQKWGTTKNLKPYQSGV